MKRTLRIALSLCAVVIAHSARTGTAQIGETRILKLAAPTSTAASQVTLQNSSARGMQFRVRVSEVATKTVILGQRTFNDIAIEGFSNIAEPGKPALPVLGKMVALPVGADVSLQVRDVQYEEFRDFYVSPALPPQPEAQQHAQTLELDASIYQKDVFFPEVSAWTEPVKIVRTLPVTIVWISPVQWNPASGVLKVATEMTVEVSFSGGSTMAIESRFRSPQFDGIFSRMLENWSVVEEANSAMPEYSPSEAQDLSYGADYLIITADAFSASADSLALWRRYTGRETRVACVEDIGVTAENIKNYILTAYREWNPAPSYVVFLGDAEFVPTNYMTDHPSDDQGLIGTDLYYAMVDGSDYFPDLFTGRISVQTAAEAHTFVNKIIEYEKNPLSDGAFYNNVSVVAYFQDDDTYNTPNTDEPDGYEDRRFVRTSEEMRDYLLTKDYSVRRIYYAEKDVPPTNYNYPFWGNGEPLPPDLLIENGFQWDGDAAAIKAAIEQGAFLVSHRDHGSRSGWGDPEYRSPDVAALRNGARLPVVLSTNCNTGWFDNETDEGIEDTGSNSECFVERWLRSAEGGAIGVFGSTRISYSGYNDALAKGWIDAIWPDFLSYAAYADNDPIYALGVVLNYGKFYMATQYSSTTTRKVEFEEFHFFGDPTTKIWTQYPGNLSVQGPDSCFLNQTAMTVDAGIAGAQVTLLQLDELVATVESNSVGSAALSFRPLSSQEPLTLSVVKPNYRPHISQIPVFPSAGVCVVFESIEIRGQDDNDEINIGEQIEWNVQLRNVSPVTVEQIQVTLVCENEYITMLDSVAVLDSLRGEESVSVTDLSFAVDKLCPHNHDAHVDLMLSAGQEYRVEVPLDIKVYKGEPRIRVSPEMVVMRVNSLGDSSTSNLTIENTGFDSLEVFYRDQNRELVSVGQSNELGWIAVSTGTGNIYKFDQQSLLRKFGCYMQISSPVTITFLVYVGDEYRGVYYKIAETSKFVDTIGNNYYHSDPLGVAIDTSKYYYLGIIWEGGDAGICRAPQLPPIELSVGSLLSGCMNVLGSPAPESFNQTFTRMVYFVQEVEIGRGDWLELQPTSEILLPTEKIGIPLNFKATDSDTSLFTYILLSTNDPENDTLLIPTYFIVGEQVAQLVGGANTIDDSEGDNNGEVNIGETIILPLHLKNIGTATASNISAHLRTEDAFITLVDSTETVSSLNSDAEITLDAFSFITSPYSEDGHLSEFTVQVYADNAVSTELQFTCTIVNGAPAISVSPDSLTATVSQLYDSLVVDVEVVNEGYGALIYQLDNPVHQKATVGSLKENFLPLVNNVGHIYYQEKDARLLRVSHYLKADTSYTVHFFVYENDSLRGVYTNIAKCSIEVENGAPRWVDSGILDCHMVAGNYYFIGVGSTTGAVAGLSGEICPIATPHGYAIAGSVVPGGEIISEQINITTQLGNVLISQKITTGEGEWLQCSAEPDTLYPGEGAAVPVTFFGTDPDTTFTATLAVVSNDPHEMIVYIPTRFSSTSSPAGVPIAGAVLPEEVILWQNYPNPFNPVTEIRYGISTRSKVELSVYNILGQKIKRLVDEQQEPGIYQVLWDGIDDDGRNVASGVYFILLKSAQTILQRKIALIK